jgi:Putative prokaryotic signal transducing protein
MYCQSCASHAGPSGTKCPKCGGELLDIPGPPPDPDIELVSVFRTGDAGLIPLAKSLLDSESIEYLVRGEAVQDLFGSGRLGAGYNIVTGPAEFVVRQADADRARSLLADLTSSTTSTDRGE